MFPVVNSVAAVAAILGSESICHCEEPRRSWGDVAISRNSNSSSAGAASWRRHQHPGRGITLPRLEWPEIATHSTRPALRAPREQARCGRSNDKLAARHSDIQPEYGCWWLSSILNTGPFPGRSTVGLRTLNPPIQVRILAREPAALPQASPASAHSASTDPSRDPITVLTRSPAANNAKAMAMAAPSSSGRIGHTHSRGSPEAALPTQ